MKEATMKTQETRENRSVSSRNAPSATETNLSRDPNRNLSRRNELFGPSTFDPFDLIRSFWNLSPAASPWSPFSGRSERGQWAPQIETVQRGNEFVVRADLPGLEQKDISVELKDDAIVIEGERSNEREQREEGYYASERSYGRFCRVVPLPEGAIGDSAKASFKNGVLEVVMQAPPHEVSRGRRIEITDAGSEKR
jgi:HSP20 family protein